MHHYQEKFDDLRLKYPVFVFEDFEYTFHQNKLIANYSFTIGTTLAFHPVLEIQLPAGSISTTNNNSLIRNLVFHMGMIELISYWKCACPPLVLIKPGYLSSAQIEWWKKLYFNGLGEFFYLNGIPANLIDFMQITCANAEILPVEPVELNPGYLVPIGGGKDSVVTLELLKKTGQKCVPFIINPRGATLDCVTTAGYLTPEIITMKRVIDPELLKLNDIGYLNGHTPFSAMLAFSSITVAVMSGYESIALSNEASANESTVPNSTINHQYSKSFEFEADFRKYYQTYITPSVNYFSFLRPLNELQIASLFANFPQYYSVFRSCNVGSKTDSWCGKCPKCLFVYTMLSPFLPLTVVSRIFNKDLFSDTNLITYLDELTGSSEVKPFECVGTLDEVKAALAFTAQRDDYKNLPLIVHYTKSHSSYSVDSFWTLLKDFNKEHYLSPAEEQLLTEAIYV
jgi:hypothetical protein